MADSSSVSKGCLEYIFPNSWEEFLLEFSTETITVHTDAEASQEKQWSDRGEGLYKL